MSPFLYASLALFAIWAIVLFFSKSTRHEQLVMSVIGLVLTPGAIVVASLDYRATGSLGGVGIEDFIFAFSLFGLASVLYQAVLGKHLKKLRGGPMFFTHPASHWLAHIVIALGIWAVLSLAFTVILSLTTVQSVIVSGLLIGTYVIADRKDLVFDALLSGLFICALVFTIEQLFFIRLFPDAASTFWQAQRLSGLTLGGIPLEELIWSGVVGFAIGPLYEYMREMRVK